MEGFLEFMVYSLLNYYTLDLKTNGEILGFVVSLISSFFGCLFVPVALIWVIFTKNEKQLARIAFRKKWKALYEF